MTSEMVNHSKCPSWICHFDGLFAICMCLTTDIKHELYGLTNTLRVNYHFSVHLVLLDRHKLVHWKSCMMSSHSKLGSFDISSNEQTF